MEITPVGAVLVFLGLCFLAVKPELLYWCAIFFLPFSATAVVNVGSNGSFSGLQAWMFFGTLWLAREASGMMGAGGGWYAVQKQPPVRKLLIFLLVAFVSLVMPLWIDGRLWIQSAVLDSSEAQPLFLRAEHITQILYLAYGVVFAIFVAARNLNLGEFRKTIRVFLLSSVFVCSWGLVQWVSYLSGIPYPAFLLNTNKNETAMGYLAQFGDLDVARISSVATEPSMLAQYLLIALVLATFAVIGQRPIISRLWDRAALALCVLLLLLTTSSTAYLGLGLVVPLIFLGFLVVGKLRPRYFVIAAGILLLAIPAIYARSATVQDVANAAIFTKAYSYSGLERLNSVVLAEGYFLRYPLLGVGWGSVTSHDLIFKLLANTGIAGFLAFALFLKSSWSGLWRAAVPQEGAEVREWNYWATCLLVASLILVLTNIFTEFAFVFGHFWFVFGMGLAVCLSHSMGCVGVVDSRGNRTCG